MSKLRYKVTEFARDEHGRNFHVFDLREIDIFNKPERYNVEMSDYIGYPQCLHCSTPLKAMSGSCVHAQAVKRSLKKQAGAYRLAQINEEVTTLFTEEDRQMIEDIKRDIDPPDNGQETFPYDPEID